MSTLKPFIFGGIASITAEVGESRWKLTTSQVGLKEISIGYLLSCAKSYYCFCLGTFPLDTTKTRLQVQGQHMDQLCRSSRYRGMVHALMRIPQEEGVRALYKGWALPCLCGWVRGRVAASAFSSWLWACVLLCGGGFAAVGLQPVPCC